MANYAVLKAAIEDVIKTNGENAITGQILQNSLIAMINALGAGYQFAGVATPETNPGTPDQNVMYIAGVGTYPNFGPTTVKDGEIGIFKYNGSWDCKVIQTDTTTNVININAIAKHPLGYATPALAVADVPERYRKLGCTVVFKDDTTEDWVMMIYHDDFGGDDAWTDIDNNWRTIGPVWLKQSGLGDGNYILQIGLNTDFRIVNNLETDTPYYVLSARQGKLLNEKIEGWTQELESIDTTGVQLPRPLLQGMIITKIEDATKLILVGQYEEAITPADLPYKMQHNAFSVKTESGTATDVTIGVRGVLSDDFINVNDYYGHSAAYASAQAARADVALTERKKGLYITYLLSVDENTTQWVTDQFIGDDIADWGVAANWIVFEPVSVSQNTETSHINIGVGSAKVSVASVSDIANVDLKVGVPFRHIISLNDGGEQILLTNINLIKGLTYQFNFAFATLSHAVNFSIRDNQGNVLVNTDVSVGANSATLTLTLTEDKPNSYIRLYNNEVNIDIDLSIDITYGATIDNRLNNLTDSTKDLSDLTEIQKGLKTLTAYITGKCILFADGLPTDVTDGVITDGIQLRKNDILVFTCTNYAAIAVLSKRYGTGSTFKYIPLIKSVGSSAQDHRYYWQADEDCTVVISYLSDHISNAFILGSDNLKKVYEYLYEIEPDTTVISHNGYLKTDGSIGGINNSGVYGKHTNIIPCQSGDVFLYKGLGEYNAQSVLYLIDGIISSYAQYNSVSSYTEITIPNNINGVIFGSYIASGTRADDVVLDVIRKSPKSFKYLTMDNSQDLSTKSDILYGKKWVACGDSYTHGESGIASDVWTDEPYLGYRKTYPYWIGRRHNMVIVDAAVAGRTLTYIDGTHNEFSAANGPYTQIPTDAEYITLWFGINDAAYNAPIGNVDDNVNTTFYGAWNIVLTWIITNCPNAKIGIVVTNSPSDIPTYLTAIRTIAGKYGIPTLDLQKDDAIPYYLFQSEKTNVLQAVKDARNAYYRVASDNAHPNVKAHEYQSTFIEEWLKSL